MHGLGEGRCTADTGDIALVGTVVFAGSRAIGPEAAGIHGGHPPWPCSSGWWVSSPLDVAYNLLTGSLALIGR